MINLIVWSITAFGFCWVVADSKVSLPFRMWLEKKSIGSGFLHFLATFFLAMFECVACTGFHVGWISYLCGVTAFTSWWTAAFFTCGSNLLWAKYVGLLDHAD